MKYSSILLRIYQRGPDNQYLSLQELETHLREFCTAPPPQIPDHLTLRHFSAVGAYVSDNGKMPINDNISIGTSFFLLLQAGFRIHPDFELDIVNLNDGRDFLSESEKTDVAIFCGICDGGPKFNLATDEDHQKYLQRLREHEQRLKVITRSNHDIFHYYESPHAQTTDGWRNSLIQRQTKIAFNNDTNLRAARLCSDRYLQIASGKNHSTKSLGLDIIGEHGFLASMLPYLDPGTPLFKAIGQELQAAASISAVISAGKPATP